MLTKISYVKSYVERKVEKERKKVYFIQIQLAIGYKYSAVYIVNSQKYVFSCVMYFSVELNFSTLCDMYSTSQKYMHRRYFKITAQN